MSVMKWLRTLFLRRSDIMSELSRWNNRWTCSCINRQTITCETSPLDYDKQQIWKEAPWFDTATEIPHNCHQVHCRPAEWLSHTSFGGPHETLLQIKLCTAVNRKRQIIFGSCLNCPFILKNDNCHFKRFFSQIKKVAVMVYYARRSNWALYKNSAF